jgi:hypothetical protein
MGGTFRSPSCGVVDFSLNAEHLEERMDEQEKKVPPKDDNGKEHNVPLEGEQTREEGGSLRELGAADDESAGGDGQQADEASEAGAEGSEADRLRSVGYLSVTEVRNYLKRCYKHVSSGEVPVVVMIAGETYWYPITGIEAIQNAKDGSQAIVITLMPRPDQVRSKIEVVKNVPRGPEDVS